MPSTPPPPDGPYDWIIYNSDTNTNFQVSLLGVTGTVSQRTPVAKVSCVYIDNILNQISAGTTNTWKFNKLIGYSNMAIYTRQGNASTSIPTFWRNGVQVFPTKHWDYVENCVGDPNPRMHWVSHKGVWFDEIRLTADTTSIIYIGLRTVAP
ncbi:hypothetical protein [Chryseobacterium limigenitum]|uniref:hypothetical protein n=1 Tax=Chryseobacterium limigenitum TaxID=1612149 RepID=UPI001114B6CC|nr:hypothetical protein [Chryseobacterium limigenitum]